MIPSQYTQPGIHNHCQHLQVLVLQLAAALDSGDSWLPVLLLTAHAFTTLIATTHTVQ